MRPWIVAVVVVGAIGAVVAVVTLGSNREVRDPMTGATEFDIPPKDPQLVAQGETLYEAYCAACHGSDLRGTAAGPSQLSVIYQPGHHPDEAYALAVLNGVRSHHWDFGDMAPVSGLTTPQVDAIVAYIRQMQRMEGFEPYPP
jgi:mono/diheme cytochrome c family protein